MGRMQMLPPPFDTWENTVDWLAGAPLRIVLILLAAVVVRWLVNRSIRTVTERAVERAEVCVMVTSAASDEPWTDHGERPARWDGVLPRDECASRYWEVRRWPAAVEVPARTACAESCIAARGGLGVQPDARMPAGS